MEGRTLNADDEVGSAEGEDRRRGSRLAHPSQGSMRREESEEKSSHQPRSTRTHLSITYEPSLNVIIHYVELNQSFSRVFHKGGARTIEIGPIRNQNLIFQPLANNLGKLTEDNEIGPSRIQNLIFWPLKIPLLAIGRMLYLTRLHWEAVILLLVISRGKAVKLVLITLL